MLILPFDRPRTEHHMWQHPGITPNERYMIDADYRNSIDTWAAKWRQPGPHRFQQVRLIRSKTQIGHTHDWWNQGPWQDCIFWVFQKPLYTNPEGKKHYGYYSLEYFESQRVIDWATGKHGYNPFPNKDEMLVLPVELCHHAARHEFSAGVSDHLRPRPEIALTQEEIDREARAQEIVAKKEKELIDIQADPRWQQTLNAPCNRY